MTDTTATGVKDLIQIPNSIDINQHLDNVLASIKTGNLSFEDGVSAYYSFKCIKQAIHTLLTQNEQFKAHFESLKQQQQQPIQPPQYKQLPTIPEELEEIRKQLSDDEEKDA